MKIPVRRKTDNPAGSSGKIGQTEVLTGQGFSQSEIDRSVNTSITANALGMVWAAAVISMPLPLFLEAVGVSGLMIGLVAAIPLLAEVLQIPGTYVVERLPYRKPFWATLTMCQRLLWFIPALLPFMIADNTMAYSIAILFTVAISSLLANAAAPAWQSWMADLMLGSKMENLRSKRHIVLTIGFLAGLALMGWTLHINDVPDAEGMQSLTGFSILFALGAAFGVADVLVNIWVAEPLSTKSPLTHDLGKRLSGIWKDRVFQRITYAMGAWYFGLGVIGSFFFIAMKRDLGFNYFMVAIVAIMAGLGGAIASYHMGRVMDHIGPRLASIILAVCGPIILAGIWFIISEETFMIPFTGIALPSAFLVLALAALLLGTMYAGVTLCQVKMTAALSSNNSFSLALPLHWGVVGLFAMLGPVVGGLIMDWFDRNPPAMSLPSALDFGFFHVLVLIHLGVAVLVVLPLLVSLPFHGNYLSTGTTRMWITTLNPLQGIRNITNIGLLATPDLRDRLQPATAEDGSDEPKQSTDALIAKLDDPWLDTREYAVRKLGIDGSPKAIAALRQILIKQDPLLIMDVAHALRQCGEYSCVAPLIANLVSQDREVAVQCARTLGEIGDPRAVSALKDVFSSSLDDKVVCACAIALGQLGDYSVVPSMIERVLLTSSYPVKMTLGIAISNLFGETDAYYNLIMHEKLDEGSAMQTLQLLLKNNLTRSLRDNTTAAAVSKLVDQLNSNLIKRKWEHCADYLEEIYHSLWQIVEARKLSTRKLELSSKFIFGLRKRVDKRPVSSEEILLGLYLLTQSIPGASVKAGERIG